MALTFDHVQNAYAAIRESTMRTPCIKAARMSLHLGIDLYFKLENLQHTNSFKARGALNKLLTLDADQRARGVIACSAGNHAQGVAYHAQRLGIPATIVMPHGTPFNKIAKTEDFGGRVVLHGKNFDESVDFTLNMAEKENYVFIHPFDDIAVAAGQGTLGLEMLEQQPELDCIVVPIGGGGMIAGVATAVKGIKPSIEVIGAQADLYNAVQSKSEGKSKVEGGSTLAEGIAVKQPGARNLKIIRALVSEVWSASEEQIEEAVFDLLSSEKLVVEGAAGAGLAVIQKNLSHFKKKKTGLVISGGNIDSRLLSTLIMRGLVRDGRIARLRFEIDDTPGQLSDISRIIGESSANVVEVIHQRLMQTVSLKKAELDIVIEARDRQHVRELVETLKAAGFKVSAMGKS
ncbi:MAG: threonine ammonia-lyase [Alphaproteobacteria bacterium]|nr:threonine ammonia-lyase [Alphaproteobacteria bacterium]